MFTTRDLADKYRAVLDSILTFGEDELVEGLKARPPPASVTIVPRLS